MDTTLILTDDQPACSLLWLACASLFIAVKLNERRDTAIPTLDEHLGFFKGSSDFVYLLETKFGLRPRNFDFVPESYQQME